MPSTDAASAGGTRIFVLSPASLRGVRGSRILEGGSAADVARRLWEGGRVPLGEVFEHISGLYYRGKRAYARRFGRATDRASAVLVVTPTRGLWPDEAPVELEELRDFAAVDIDPADERYRRALRRTLEELGSRLGEHGQVVLLGSIATDKYLVPLVEVLGNRVLVPADFAGRGDMSRGGLLLRAVAAGSELAYVGALGAERSGPRPPRLDPATRPGRG